MASLNPQNGVADLFLQAFEDIAKEPIQRPHHKKEKDKEPSRKTTESHQNPTNSESHGQRLAIRNHGGDAQSEKTFDSKESDISSRKSNDTLSRDRGEIEKSQSTNDVPMPKGPESKSKRMNVISDLEPFIISLLQFAPKQKLSLIELSMKVQGVFGESIKELTGMQFDDFFRKMSHQKDIEIGSKKRKGMRTSFARIPRKTKKTEQKLAESDGSRIGDIAGDKKLKSIRSSSTERNDSLHRNEEKVHNERQHHINDNVLNHRNEPGTVFVNGSRADKSEEDMIDHRNTATVPNELSIEPSGTERKTVKTRSSLTSFKQMFLNTLNDVGEELNEKKRKMKDIDTERARKRHKSNDNAGYSKPRRTRGRPLRGFGQRRRGRSSWR